ncbi:GNAT family N-acetyltransferase [Roseobacter sp.]|uniref:GNAT family N-acetyltransferase n=1 Tax=Roseobacter sp. TaxID=1907202 RepID=UPI0038582243
MVRVAEMPRDLAVVQELCWEYRDFLIGFNEDMREIAETFYPKDAYATLMEELPVKHARPRGVIMLIEHDGKPIGCGMTHPLKGTDTEVKRVFIRKSGRGTGAGQMLSKALIDQARKDGYRRVLLDTSVWLTGAQRLYEKLGFKSRGPYSDLPPGTERHLVFYELML